MQYGAILAPYLADPHNFFIISSDFCHWGQRFNYTWMDESKGNIWQSIEWLDSQGMTAIESLDPLAFQAYQETYGNTICGRNPITVFLQVCSYRTASMVTLSSPTILDRMIYTLFPSASCSCQCPCGCYTCCKEIHHMHSQAFQHNVCSYTLLYAQSGFPNLRA